MQSTIRDRSRVKRVDCNKTQFEALLQTQAAEVGCTALEKTSLTRNYSLVAEFGEF